MSYVYLSRAVLTYTCGSIFGCKNETCQQNNGKWKKSVTIKTLAVLFVLTTRMSQNVPDNSMSAVWNRPLL